MATCPKCGKKLRLYHWRPECPACGVNMIYFASNERLDAKFFMGFYCQKQDFYKKATKETEE